MKKSFLLIFAFLSLSCQKDEPSKTEPHVDCALVENNCLDPYHLGPAAQVARSICSRLQSCDSTLSFWSCEVDLMASNQIPLYFQLNAQYSTGDSLEAATQSSYLSYDSRLVSACTETLDALACSSPRVQASLDPTMRLKMAEGIGACEGIFRVVDLE